MMNVVHSNGEIKTYSDLALSYYYSHTSYLNTFDLRSYPKV